MGAGLALWLALEKRIAVKGVIAIAPFLRSAEELRPLLSQDVSQKLRFYLVASKGDRYCYNVARDLSKLLTEYKIEHRLDLYDDVEHTFPLSFEQKLPEALSFIVSE
jgi:dienelactone hydrolase